MRTLVLSIVAVVAASSFAICGGCLSAAGLRRRASARLSAASAGLTFRRRPPAYGPPPVVAYGPPVYARPRGIIVAPEGPAYEVSEPAYQPGDEYVQGPRWSMDAATIANAGWDWGYRRCALKPRWW